MLPISSIAGTPFKARVGTFQGQKGNACYKCASRMLRSALRKRSTPSLDMLAKDVAEGSTAHSSGDPSNSSQVVTTDFLKDLGLEMDGPIITAMAPWPCGMPVVVLEWYPDGLPSVTDSLVDEINRRQGALISGPLPLVRPALGHILRCLPLHVQHKFLAMLSALKSRSAATQGYVLMGQDHALSVVAYKLRGQLVSVDVIDSLGYEPPAQQGPCWLPGQVAPWVLVARHLTYSRQRMPPSPHWAFFFSLPPPLWQRNYRQCCSASTRGCVPFSLFKSSRHPQSQGRGAAVSRSGATRGCKAQMALAWRQYFPS
jgi:hypothetical protein